MDDLELLVDLCGTVKEASLCGLGQTAPNPVLSTLKYFKNEYIEHIVHKRCPAGVCNMAGASTVEAAQWRCWHERRPLKSKHWSSTARKSAPARGQTILEVAQENEIDIPTLCHLDGLSDVGACRLCLVEIKGSNKLLPACVATVCRRHGGKHQHGAAPEASPHHPGAAVCRAQSHLLGVRGQWPLRTADAGADQGVTHVRLPYRNPELTVDASHERFTLDHNRCILCTRCVRVCAEIEGAHVWDVMGRGIDCDDHRRSARGVGQVQPARAAASACRFAQPERCSTRARSAPITPSTLIFCRT